MLQQTQFKSNLGSEIYDQVAKEFDLASYLELENIFSEFMDQQENRQFTFELLQAAESYTDVDIEAKISVKQFRQVLFEQIKTTEELLRTYGEDREGRQFLIMLAHDLIYKKYKIGSDVLSAAAFVYNEEI